MHMRCNLHVHVIQSGSRSRGCTRPRDPGHSPQLLLPLLSLRVSPTQKVGPPSVRGCTWNFVTDSVPDDNKGSLVYERS